MTHIHELTHLDADADVEIEAILADLKTKQVIPRIWAKDHTVWKLNPTEISNRLGWLGIAKAMLENLPEIDVLVKALQNEGYTHVLLLGMGGSSLAPEVFRKTFGVQEGYLDLAVLDSTDPNAVAAFADTLDLNKTLFIVSTKSGGTVETLSFFKYFYNQVVDQVGTAEAGQHFVAITDPGSQLVELAEQHNFRTTFLNDPNIGGRYSALSYFGLVPAALLGLDLTLLLNRAQMAVCNAGGCNQVESDNLSARLGVTMGYFAKVGRDKVTLVASPQLASFGDWVEQLIAESTGKEGRGLLPVVGETLGTSDSYGQDRLFVYLRLNGDNTYDAAIKTLAKAGHPVVTFALEDRYDLGAQFFIWEMATAIAGALIDINPFDQPDVEAAKVLARQMVAAYHREGKLPVLSPTLTHNGLQVFGNVSATSPSEALAQFLAQAQPGAYIAIQAYVQPTAAVETALQAFRLRLRDRTQLATTLGYGPRFLHSTGQLHKGDGGQGLFIQIISDELQDVAIPNEAGNAASAMSFGVLKASQSLGDRQALLDNGRQVLRFQVEADIVGQIKALTIGP